jgi:hypothetical protein
LIHVANSESAIVFSLDRRNSPEVTPIAARAASRLQEAIEEPPRRGKAHSKLEEPGAFARFDEDLVAAHLAGRASGPAVPLYTVMHSPEILSLFIRLP